MNGQLANLEDLKRQKTEAMAQEKRTIPPLWNRLRPEYRKQLAQQLAKMIQQIRQVPRQEKSDDERV